MGMDLFVSEQTDFRFNDKGQAQYTVTELYNFRPYVPTIMEYVGELDAIDNNTTVTIDATEFIHGLRSMKDSLALMEADETIGRYPKDNLKGAIKKMEEFINIANIKISDGGERTFEVNLWY